MIRLLCVEDNPLVRAYLEQRLALEADFRVVSTVCHARGALNFLANEEIDVVLLDYQLDDATTGMRVLEALSDEARGSLATGRRPAVLFCTGMADAAFETEARARGARGVVAKDRVVKDLVPAVRAVAAGGRWFGGTALPAEERVLAPVPQPDRGRWPFAKRSSNR